MEAVTQEDRSGFTLLPSVPPSIFVCVWGEDAVTLLGHHLCRSHRFHLDSPLSDYLWRSLAAPEKHLASGLASATEKFGLGKSFTTQHFFFWWWCCCVTKSVQSATLFKEVWLKRQKRKMPSLLQIRSVSFVSYFYPPTATVSICA